MATTHDHDDFHLNSNELPPPAYELSDAELDRKIAAAAQRSLALNEQHQSGRPTLPPIDEDGFPIWSDELFEFNRQQREREAEEARNNKAQAEYRPSAQHHYSAPSSSASSSSSPPPVHARPLNNARRSLPPVVEGSIGTNASKQKQDRLGWMDENAQGIAQDEDLHPPITATQNAGRPPMSTRAQAHLQVQVGPRPHDVLAQPQSPVSDAEDDMVGAALCRAPTYHPRGQAHPGHARVISERVSRRSTDSAAGGLSRNSSVDLPAWTAVAPSLEGPAYDEVMRTTTPADGRVSNPASPPPVPSMPAVNVRRQSGIQSEWKPVQAKPQVQERVAGARQSTIGVPAAQPAWVASPSTYTASPSAYTPSSSAPTLFPASAPAPAFVPAPNPAPAPAQFSTHVAPRPGEFDPGVAYRSAQNYGLTGRKDSVSGNGIADAQRELHNSGAHAFYNSAVASTISKAPVFKAPPPPPQRMGTIDDDGVSVLSGRSGGAQQSSVYSGGAGTRMSMYGGAPVGGIMSGGAPLPGTTTYAPPLPLGGGYQPGGPGASGYQPGAYQPTAGGYQPGLGAQVPGAGGYQPNVQPGPGGYQPQWTPSGQPAGTGTYQPQSAGTFNPQPSPTFNPQPSGMAYHPQQQPTMGGYQPQYQPQHSYGQAGVPMIEQAGSAPVPGQASATFVAPPPPPKRFGGKLYKRL